MEKDERDLLEVLKSELEFLQQGGYGRSPRTPWKPQYVFEDSPTCMNFDSKESPGPCSDCVLMHLVPRERRSEKLPCRHIPFNVSGETLDSLYRHRNQQRTEQTVGDWLLATIQRLEEERMVARGYDREQPTLGYEVRKASPLFQDQHPKCANIDCPNTFHWIGGGKFFRFRPDPASQAANDVEADWPRGIHGVRHFWLCERCSHVFTLVYERGCGVVLRELWVGRPEVHARDAAHTKM